MRSNGNDSLVSLEGSYKLFGKVSWIRFENVDWNGDKIFGVGENSDGKYSVTGSYVRGARASFVVSYAGRAGMRFQGGVTEGGRCEGAWGMDSGLGGSFEVGIGVGRGRLDTEGQRLVDVEEEEEFKRGMMTSEGRQIWISLTIVTPEKANCYVKANINWSVEELKEAISDTTQYFLKNEKVQSTKKLKGGKAGAKFGASVSSIGAIHNHSRFQLTPTDIRAPAEKSYVRLPNLAERELDGLALSAQKTIGYYGIISGTTLYMHLEMYIEIIGLEMQAPILTNNFVICKLKHTTKLPRFHVKVFPSDTCGQVKIKIHEYLKSCIMDANKNSTETEQEKETKLQLDLDRIRTEKWV